MVGTITLVTHEGECVLFSRRLVELSEFIACMPHSVASEASDEVDIGGLGIDSRTFSLIAEFCQHCDFTSRPALISPLKSGTTLAELYDVWEVAFLEKLDDDSKLSLILAAEALGIESLLQMLSVSISISLMDKSEDEVSVIMGEGLNLNPREEGYLYQEYQWAKVSHASRERALQET